MLFQRNIIVIIFVMVITSSFLSCATAPRKMEFVDTQRIDRMAIVTLLFKDDLQVLDHSNFDSSVYYGANGALGGLIMHIIADASLKSSLGGDPEALKQELKNYPVKQHVDKILINNFFTDKFTIVSPQEIDSLRIANYTEKKSINGMTIRDYTEVQSKFNVDTILEIEYLYGLAAYSGGVKPSAVVSADMTVIDIATNKVLMKKRINSDEFYRGNYTVREYIINHAELYKNEFKEAAYGFTHLIAKEFGEELSLKKKSYWNPDKN